MVDINGLNTLTQYIPVLWGLCHSYETMICLIVWVLDLYVTIFNSHFIYITHLVFPRLWCNLIDKNISVLQDCIQHKHYIRYKRTGTA